MNSWGVRAVVALLAVVCVGGGILLGARVGFELYTAQRSSLVVACNELPDHPPPGVEGGEDVRAQFGLIPLGVWCTYPADDGGDDIILAPPWSLTGIAAAALGLLALGIAAATVRSRLTEASVRERARP